MAKKTALSTLILTCLCAFLPLLTLTGCANQPITIDKTPKTHTAYQLNQPLTIDADWNKPAWKNAQPVDLTYYMGEKPDHIPNVQIKTAYDNDFIYVIFHVQDQYVRAVAQNHQDSVCRDSCAEFFFSTNDQPQAYFNLEVNCGGTVLLHTHKTAEDYQPVAIEDCQKIIVKSTLPKIVDPEITTPTTWTLEYAIPFSMLEKYQTVNRPKPNTAWRANFYKCADKTSHPHWLTWSHVDLPNPNFHQPKFFGTLKFK